MNGRRAVAAAALLLLTPGRAAEKATQETAAPRPLTGVYQVYGGSLADMLPPAPKDRNLLVRFEGKTARDLFEYIGPDRKKDAACTDDPDYRERRRGDLTCTYWKSSGYSCLLGLNLKTGKSENGAIC
jgi:hypothetical protein